MLTSGKEVIVGVGDCRLARYPIASLVTYALGSCVAIIVYDWKSRLGALLHVMLPDSSIDPARAGTNPYLYVDTGVTQMLTQLEKMGGSKHRIRCCIVGGASMMADSSHFKIGKRNHLAARRIFWRLGVFVDKEDVGGTQSRSVRLDLETGQIELRTGVAHGRILVPGGISLKGEIANHADFTR